MTAIVHAIENDTKLDKAAKVYARWSGALTKPKALKNLLSGGWLGHQLHPMLTDLPIGAWGAATFLDLTAGEKGAAAAQRLVGAGLLATVPTAMSGANDYADTYGAEQRIGFVHGMTNVVGAGFQAASWLARRRGNRALGIVLSGVGFGITSGAAYLGGHLTLVRGIGVNHTAYHDNVGDWTDVAALDDLTDGTPHKVTAGGVAVVLVRAGNTVRALSDVCTHAGGPLHEGTVADGCIECPWHGSRFRLSDGSVERGPASVPAPTWEVRVDGGRVAVRSSD